MKFYTKLSIFVSLSIITLSVTQCSSKHSERNDEWTLEMINNNPHSQNGHTLAFKQGSSICHLWDSVRPIQIIKKIIDGNNIYYVFMDPLIHPLGDIHFIVYLNHNTPPSIKYITPYTEDRFVYHKLESFNVQNHTLSGSFKIMEDISDNGLQEQEKIQFIINPDSPSLKQPQYF